MCASERAGTYRAADHLSTSKIYSAASGKGHSNDLIACQHLHRETRTGTSSFLIFLALNRNSYSKSLEPRNQTVSYPLTWVQFLNLSMMNVITFLIYKYRVATLSGKKNHWVHVLKLKCLLQTNCFWANFKWSETVLFLSHEPVELNACLSNPVLGWYIYIWHGEIVWRVFLVKKTAFLVWRIIL